MTSTTTITWKRKATKCIFTHEVNPSKHPQGSAGNKRRMSREMRMRDSSEINVRKLGKKLS